jgi:hypothetical protein
MPSGGAQVALGSAAQSCDMSTISRRRTVRLALIARTTRSTRRCASTGGRERAGESAMIIRNSRGHHAEWQPAACQRAGRVYVAASFSRNCADILDLIVAAALDLALPGDEITVGAHVAACRRCAVALAELRSVAASLGAAIPQVEPPATLRGRIVSAAMRARAAAPPSANPATQSNGAANADY